MKLINSVNGSRYKTIDTIFISDNKWEFLADKYRITLNEEDWADLEVNYMLGKDTSAIYGDVNGHSCLNILDDRTYIEVEQLLNHRKVILYTNEDKNFHILIQCDY